MTERSGVSDSLPGGPAPGPNGEAKTTLAQDSFWWWRAQKTRIVRVREGSHVDRRLIKGAIHAPHVVEMPIRYGVSPLAREAVAPGLALRCASVGRFREVPPLTSMVASYKSPTSGPEPEAGKYFHVMRKSRLASAKPNKKTCVVKLIKLVGRVRRTNLMPAAWQCRQMYSPYRFLWHSLRSMRVPQAEQTLDKGGDLAIDGFLKVLMRRIFCPVPGLQLVDASQGPTQWAARAVLFEVGIRPEDTGIIEPAAR